MLAMQTIDSIKYCLYARKSSEQDERQAKSIDSQLKEMLDIANKDSLTIVDYKQESFSAKQSGCRPVFNQLLEDLKNEKYNGILTWAPDRLSRNAGDLGSLVDLMDAGKLEQIRTQSQCFSNNPNEKFLLMILCSQAKLENDNRGVNVKRGIRAKCEMGWRPCMPPLGYYTRGASGNGKDLIVDELRAPYIKQMFEMASAGKGGRHIRQWLEDNNIRTRGDKLIPLSMIYRMLKSSFYYGEFEYPAGSGNWYSGNHTPIIDKELFNKVQIALKVPAKTKWGSKQFPFKQFLKCYSCNSSIVGEEKNRKRIDGSSKQFIYYHCSRQIDYHCKELSINEYEIIEQLSAMCDELITDLPSIELTLRQAIDKFSRMMEIAHSKKNHKRLIGSYVKYVLNSGTQFEKTRLIRNLKIDLAIHNKTIVKL